MEDRDNNMWRSSRDAHMRSQSDSRRGRQEEVEDNWHTQNLHEAYGPKRRHWHTRPKSPGLKWYKHYSPESLKEGRVLVVDYLRQEMAAQGTRKVAAQEINNVNDLRRLYDTDRRAKSILRVYHLQNADWAEAFLLKKFNISARDDLVGSDFGRYVCFKHPISRNGRPRLGGKAWEAQHDPWRSISKTSIGLDYLKCYGVKEPSMRSPSDTNGKMMELNCYDEATEAPKYGFDIHAQRLSLYIQAEEKTSEVPAGLDIKNPYDKKRQDSQKPHEYFPDLGTLDNGNTIIIFENSKSRSIRDTLIGAREKWESRWRRLPFYLAYESQSVSNDDEMARLCARTIISDVWKALAEEWQHFMDKANSHVEILESKIYERPADESRADEIWRNASAWLRCERLSYVHDNVLKEFANNLREVTDDQSGSEWLSGNIEDFNRVKNLVQEDLVKPTESLSDLMYKSVEIRDSRHSLELSYSMWRLSWITFIFLPLTFVVGFFGMNVDTFKNDPSIRWFFISAAPLMAVVLISWYVFKHSLVQSRQTPYSRGIYERLFHDLATTYPRLWSRAGPRDVQLPRSQFQRLKWWMIMHWNDPALTIRNTQTAENDAFDGLSQWSRFKRMLTKKWTAEIAGETAPQWDDTEKEQLSGDEDISVALEQVHKAMNIHAENAHMQNGRRGVPDIARTAGSLSTADPRASGDVGRPVSQAGSGGRNSVIVEEQGPDFVSDSPTK